MSSNLLIFDQKYCLSIFERFFDAKSSRKKVYIGRKIRGLVSQIEMGILKYYQNKDAMGEFGYQN